MEGFGVLILSHCTYSFVEPISALLKAKGLKCFILSSKPENQQEQRAKQLQELSQWHRISDGYELTWDDAEIALSTMTELGYQTIACISVWEGYRSLMSMINKQLDVEDLANDKIQMLVNKLELRQKLFSSGFSNVMSEPLNQVTFERLKDDCIKQGIQKFIKPYRGIASFGTCRLTVDMEWNLLENIVSEWKSDSIFRAIFADHDPFMVEDYIAGKEVSFEVVFLKGQAIILAVHEKIEVENKKTTMLESACVCPPTNIDEECLLGGVLWLKKVLHSLDIDVGCFHIEAKVNEGQWEIIEINPRIGGALISDSVRYFTKGYSLLEAWLDTLICSTSRIPKLNHQLTVEKLQTNLSKLDISSHGISPNQLATFFRVYFVQKGRVAKIEQHELSLKPELTQILVKEGAYFNSDNRENFVGQALWVESIEVMQNNIQALLLESRRLIQVQMIDCELEEGAIYA